MFALCCRQLFALPDGITLSTLDGNCGEFRFGPVAGLHRRRSPLCQGLLALPQVQASLFTGLCGAFGQFLQTPEFRC